RLGRASAAGLVRAVRRAAHADHGDAVPAVGALGLCEGASGADGGPPWPHWPDPDRPTVDSGPGLQGSCRAPAGLPARAGADRGPIQRRRRRSGARGVARLPVGDRARPSCIAATCGAALLVMGVLPDPDLLQPRPLADARTGAL